MTQPLYELEGDGRALFAAVRSDGRIVLALEAEDDALSVVLTREQAAGLGVSLLCAAARQGFSLSATRTSGPRRASTSSPTRPCCRPTSTGRSTAKARARWCAPGSSRKGLPFGSPSTSAAARSGTGGP
jgi:hypothetical protein